MDSERALLTSAEVADLLRVHPKHVYRLLHRGLPAKRVGGKWLFERGEVLRWAEAHGQHSDSATTASTTGTPATTPLSSPPLLAANGDLAIELLLRLARDPHSPCVGFVQADRSTGVALLDERSVLAVGVHGDEAASQPQHSGRTAWLHLVDRQVGLVRQRGRVRSVAELTRLRLASRPASAGVREYLDGALRKAGLDPARLHQRALLLPSHRDVVCAVARGEADVGLASSAWAAQLGLSFTPLLEEPYGLLIRATDLGRPEVIRLCETAQIKEYRRALAAIAGYEARHAGLLRFQAA